MFLSLSQETSLLVSRCEGTHIFRNSQKMRMQLLVISKKRYTFAAVFEACASDVIVNA